MISISLRNCVPKRIISTSRLLVIKRYQSTNENVTINKSPDYYDIVICGGGMVGTAMARSLGKDNIFKNLKIALIESSPKKNEYIKPLIHSNRVCALNDKTIDLFKSLDCYQFIQNNRYGTVKHMHVWDGSSDSFISFNGNEDNLAIIVENDLIQASLSHNLNTFENINVFYSSEIKDFKSNHQDVNIKLANGKEINTKLLIGSDGSNSFIRNKLDFNVTKWDYDQVAIVATVKLSQKQLNETAWQRFLSTGPLALLPLNEEYSSVVWSIKKALSRDLLAMSDEQFAQEINHAFVKEEFKNNVATSINEAFQVFFDFVKESKIIPQAGNYISDTESQKLPPKVETCAPKTRASFPLSFMHSNNYVKERVALIGDAVHRVHPLAGQGVNLGFGDIVCLTNALKENVVNGSAIGSSMYLQKYESTRQKEAFVKAAGIDFLNRLYTDYSYPIKTPLVALRSIGLTVSNRIVPLKEFFINQAMK